MTCGLCGEQKRVLWMECDVCGVGMCGECDDPAAHVRDCRGDEDLHAPCTRCGEYGCTPAYCEAVDDERTGEREAAEIAAAWRAGALVAL